MDWLAGQTSLPVDDDSAGHPKLGIATGQPAGPVHVSDQSIDEGVC